MDLYAEIAALPEKAAVKISMRNMVDSHVEFLTEVEAMRNILPENRK